MLTDDDFKPEGPPNERRAEWQRPAMPEIETTGRGWSPLVLNLLYWGAVLVVLASCVIAKLAESR